VEEKLRLRDVLALLEKSVDETLSYFAALDPGDLPLLLRSFALLKDHKEQLERLGEAISSLYRQYSYEVVPNALEANEMESVTIGGKLFTVSTRVNASIPENKREAGYAWLTDVAGVPELVRPTVNSQQLSSFAKSYFETNGKWPPEEVMNVHKQRYTQVRSK